MMPNAKIAGKQVDQGVQPLLFAGGRLLEAKIHLLDVDIRRGHDRAEAEDRQNREGEEDLLT
jgi:hypothetical protein